MTLKGQHERDTAGERCPHGARWESCPRSHPPTNDRAVFCVVEYGLAGHSHVVCVCGNGRPSRQVRCDRDGRQDPDGVLIRCWGCGRVLSPEGVVLADAVPGWL